MVILKELIQKRTILNDPQDEYLILDLICALLGGFILFFCLLVILYAPGKTIARYGTVIYKNNYTTDLKKKNSHLLVLLDDGKLVSVRKPYWFYLSKNKKVVLQEKSSIFWGYKRYSFYNEKRKNL